MIEDEVIFTRKDSALIKGIAALFIMTAHYTIWMQSYFQIRDFLPIKLLKQLGGIGVLLFFFLSGYGIFFSSYGKRANFAWLIKKIGNVYFPYVFMKLILEIINISVLGWDRFSMVNSLKEITGVNLSDWFVVVIILQYILFYLAWKISDKRKISITFILSVVLMSFFICFGLAARCYNGLLLFWFGLCVGAWQQKIAEYFKEQFLLKLALLSAMFFVLSVLYLLLKGALAVELLKILSGMVLGLLFALIFLKFHIKSALLRWIGNRSLYCYIIHINLWAVSVALFADFGYFMLLLSVLTVFVLVQLCYKGYELLGAAIMRSVQNIKNRHKNP